MVIAIIDIGTNTFNLLIAEADEHNKHKELYKSKIPVMLGKGGINNNYIVPDAVERGLSALREHKTTMQHFQPDRVYAFATSGIRSASNGDDFIEAARKEIGFDIQVISGNEEAEFIYYGVREALDIGEENALIMDIGGGSTEFIIANQKGIVWKESFLLGVARLFEKFQPEDPISEEQVTTIEQHLETMLTSLIEATQKHPVTELIGASGSFETFADMIAFQLYSPDILEGKTAYTFDMGEYERIHTQLLKSTKEERLHTRGIIEMRVDMIVIASVMVHFLLKRLNLHKMRLATYSLKEGVFYHLIQQSLQNN